VAGSVEPAAAAAAAARYAWAAGAATTLSDATTTLTATATAATAAAIAAGSTRPTAAAAAAAAAVTLNVGEPHERRTQVDVVALVRVARDQHRHLVPAGGAGDPGREAGGVDFRGGALEVGAAGVQLVGVRRSPLLLLL